MVGDGEDNNGDGDVGVWDSKDDVLMEDDERGPPA